MRAGEIAALAATRFALARASRANSPAEALALAALARDGHRVVRSEDDPDLVAVEAWLAEHGPATAPW